jgi:alpha-N-acetylglucosaminidase
MLTRRQLLSVASLAVGNMILPGEHSVTPTRSSISGYDHEAETSFSGAYGVLDRLLGSRAEEFDLELISCEDDRDVYQVSAERGRIRVRGSSQVALCRGAYQYLRKTGLGMVGWSGRRLALPARLPDLGERRVVCPYQFIQYFNAVTFSYTTAFWDWNRWERELDWMALHGINMPLALEGQEAIWERVWKGFGLTQAELDRYFTGPAYLPWHRMGNLDDFEGPLPQHWIDTKRVLQKRILERMRELGMSPVVPAFAGFVPEAFQRVYPRAQLFSELWSSEMPLQSETSLLHPDEVYLYREIGARFIQEYRKEYGSSQFYLADTFNELSVPAGAQTEQGLARFSRSVFEGIQAGDRDGIWVMQGWLFRSDPSFWNNTAISAYLSGVPNNRMLILDISNDFDSPNKNANADPTADNEWKNHESFFGKSWVNGMIHNGGGNNNVRGNLALIAAQPAAVLASPAKGNLCGWGMDPEGIENNEVVYELMTDIGWSEQKIPLEEWITSYCRARYGDCPPAMSKAWQLLLESAYAWHSWSSRHAWQSRPSLEPSAFGVDTSPLFHEAVESFAACAQQLRASPLYRHDLIELVAQSVGGRIDQQLTNACQAHKAGQTQVRDESAERAITMLDRVDALMNLRSDRRLETWVAAARSWGSGEDEAEFYDRNCRQLITTWGWPGAEDYAARVWSGLTRDYYAGRWRAFFDDLRANRPPNLDVWEQNWLLSPYVPSAPLKVGDLLLESLRMLNESKNWGVFSAHG